MKQKTLSDIIGALSDEPKPIGDRLEALGLEREDFSKKFSKELMATNVYGSSFLKFLEDNKQVLASGDQIPAQPLPENYQNPSAEETSPVKTRLSELGISGKDASSVLPKDVLDLSVTGSEFQDLIVANQDKFLGHLEKLALKGGKNA